MPVISIFFGIVIRMFYRRTRDRPLPRGVPGSASDFLRSRMGIRRHFGSMGALASTGMEQNAHS